MIAPNAIQMLNAIGVNSIICHNCNMNLASIQILESSLMPYAEIFIGKYCGNCGEEYSRIRKKEVLQLESKTSSKVRWITSKRYTTPEVIATIMLEYSAKPSTIATWLKKAKLNKKLKFIAEGHTHYFLGKDLARWYSKQFS